MEVILREDVDKLGKAGSIVKVKDGFARNFLIPNGLAVPLTPSNLKMLQQQIQKKNLQLIEAEKKAEELKERLQFLSLTIPVLTQEEDKLYGSVTAKDIQEALKMEGFEIDKNCIILENPIKALGIYEVTIKLHPKVSAQVRIWVVKK
ncbi:MAG: 50S ribosomal protein L9 [Candidatus Omnitrophica bacterium]|nr:50S ribosomal protein L9 [Candidatus Omnitrophota bacterium]